MEVGRFDSWMFSAAVGVNYLGLVFLSASWHIMLKSLGFKNSLWEQFRSHSLGSSLSGCCLFLQGSSWYELT